MNSTISDLKKDKKDLENKIAEMVADFAKKYDLQVQGRVDCDALTVHRCMVEVARNVTYVCNLEVKI